MRVVYRILNLEVGCFIKKRHSFFDLFNKIEFNNVLDETEGSTIEDIKWEYNAPIEKRIHVLTGYSYKEEMVTEKGYLHWLFRDVDRQCIEKPDSFNIPMILALEGTKRWGDILLNTEASEEQIDLYYRIAGILFVRTIDRIYNKDLILFRNISNNFSRDETFKKLMKHAGDNIDGL